MVATAERTLMSISYWRTHVRSVKDLFSYSEEHVVSFFFCFMFPLNAESKLIKMT